MQSVWQSWGWLTRFVITSWDAHSTSVRIMFHCNSCTTWRVPMSRSPGGIWLSSLLSLWWSIGWQSGLISCPAHWWLPNLSWLVGYVAGCSLWLRCRGRVMQWILGQCWGGWQGSWDQLPSYALPVLIARTREEEKTWARERWWHPMSRVPDSVCVTQSLLSLSADPSTCWGHLYWLSSLLFTSLPSLLSALGTGTHWALPGYQWTTDSTPKWIHHHSRRLQSVLTNCITVWYGGCMSSCWKTLQNMNTTSKVIGASLPSLMGIFIPTKSSAPLPSHPSHSLFSLLPSGRRYRRFEAQLTRTASTSSTAEQLHSPGCRKT